MLKILPRTLLEQIPNFNSFTTKLIVLQSRSPIKTFFSSESSDSSDTETNLTLSDERGEKPERVISLLKSYGFTESHISKLIRVRPRIIFADPQNSLTPKLEFLRSIGISNTDLPKLVATNPNLLWRSLEKQLIPCHKFLKSLVIDDENVVKVLKTSSRILLRDVERNTAPNIRLLTQIGVPNSVVLSMLYRYPNVAHQPHAKFVKIIEEVMSMGFNPMRVTFFNAVQVLYQSSKLTWDCKCKAYKRWGLTDDEILMAFRSNPSCMGLSEKKIMRVMDFLVNEMGWEAVRIARNPVVLSFSLENRIIPRCRVIKFLISEGIWKKDYALTTFLLPPERKFVEKFVTSYEDKVPGILNIYRGNKVSVGTGIESENLNRLTD